MLQCSTVGVNRTCGAVRPQTLVLLCSFAPYHDSQATTVGGLLQAWCNGILAWYSFARSGQPASCTQLTTHFSTAQVAPHLHRACRIIHLHLLLRHHIQLLQGVGVLRVNDVANVLRGGGAMGQMPDGSPIGAGVQQSLCSVSSNFTLALLRPQCAAYLEHLQCINGLPLFVII